VRIAAEDVLRAPDGEDGERERGDAHHARHVAELGAEAARPRENGAVALGDKT